MFLILDDPTPEPAEGDDLQLEGVYLLAFFCAGIVLALIMGCCLGGPGR